jgi:hypothetical protein
MSHVRPTLVAPSTLPSLHNVVILRLEMPHSVEASVVVINSIFHTPHCLYYILLTEQIQLKPLIVCILFLAHSIVSNLCYQSAPIFHFANIAPNALQQNSHTVCMPFSEVLQKIEWILHLWVAFYKLIF